MRHNLMPRTIFPSFFLGIIIALLLAKLIGGTLAEVVCDHPNFVEGLKAPYSVTATCENGIQVTILD